MYIQSFLKTLICSLCIVNFSVLASLKITKDENRSVLTATKINSGFSRVSLSTSCNPKGVDGLDIKNNYFKEISIHTASPLDMRYSDKRWYYVEFGDYQVCPYYFSNSERRVCEGLDFSLSSTDLRFLLQHQKINHYKVSVVPPTKTNNYWGDTVEACPENTVKNPDSFTLSCLKTELEESYNVRWIPKAIEKMDAVCRQEQDKVSSHIKRIIDW